MQMSASAATSGLNGLCRSQLRQAFNNEEQKKRKLNCYESSELRNISLSQVKCMRSNEAWTSVWVYAKVTSDMAQTSIK